MLIHIPVRRLLSAIPFFPPNPVCTGQLSKVIPLALRNRGPALWAARLRKSKEAIPAFPAAIQAERTPEKETTDTMGHHGENHHASDETQDPPQKNLGYLIFHQVPFSIHDQRGTNSQKEPRGNAPAKAHIDRRQRGDDCTDDDGNDPHMIPVCGRVWMHARTARPVNKHNGDSAAVCPRSESGHSLLCRSPICNRA